MYKTLELSYDEKNMTAATLQNVESISFFKKLEKKG